MTVELLPLLSPPETCTIDAAGLCIQSGQIAAVLGALVGIAFCWRYLERSSEKGDAGLE